MAIRIKKSCASNNNRDTVMIKYDYPSRESVTVSLTLVREILIVLNRTFKKILLYPPEHVIYQSSRNTLKESLDSFLNKYGKFVCNVDRNKILYQNDVVHEGPMDEENLAFILFRDGIYQIEFHQSIALWEINSFLEILKKYQVLTEDTENDIVTALWEVELPCLTYKAEDVGFDTGEDFEIPELGEDELSDPAEAVEEADGNPPEASFQTPAQNHRLWEITPEDQEYLRNIVEEEEDRERIGYVLDILLYILQQQTRPDEFSEVMTFLTREMQEAMLEHQYQSVYKTLKLLKKNIDHHKAEEHWSIPLLEEFFTEISAKDFLQIMHDDWHRIAKCPPEELTYLKQTLTLLNPEAVETLGPMLLETTSNQTRKLLMEVIGVLAEQKFDPLHKLLSSAHPELLKMLIYVLKFMQCDKSFQWLPELLHHESADVRKESLKAIYHRKATMIAELGLLLDDPDETVRQLFLNYSSMQRDISTEKMLLDYLQNHRLRAGNKQFLFRVYMALGRCGSDESLPFLQNNLFLLPGLRILRPRSSLRRQAAEYALSKINTDKAKSMLNKSSKSLRAEE